LILIPREYGAWAILIVPYLVGVAGVAAAGSVGWLELGGLAGVLMIAAYGM
jgi:hypothetical protein